MIVDSGNSERRRVRLYDRNGSIWASWTERGTTVRRSTRTADWYRAEEFVHAWFAAGDIGRPDIHSFFRSGTIYFVEAVGAGRVKIGWSAGQDPSRRICALQTGCPFELRLIATAHGTIRDEKAMHRRFEAQRVSPSVEWFHLTGALHQYTASLHNPRATQVTRVSQQFTTPHGRQP